MQPEPIVFFVDRSLGKRIVPRALRELGARVEIHDDHFPRDTVDADWIAKVGDLGWVVLTKDQRIRRRPLERAAVSTARVRMFALMGGNLTGGELAKLLSKHLERMTRISRSERAPFIARVSNSGILLEHLRR